ncbi:hypothetical protein GLOTRDRAFT_124470 [Gloeophyllum trabeum ATCC 11539]|uniref:Uncharacterized protein n=1 Tax=Gloeophyllum trabeum (strain ATCC 11539 / FP-39264 / Madison 617) TaxID=670483 RepID=S7S4A7_GLOTA|nr:uncharacterized protein GLOTRDRAFT_124470 [Gloeophyllum trabeum ATCC 11539]EPQ60719.1 hypothetical protein GLOTRDRAFT_124470 [Gloeophyllum trabeum ATCC 11539]
MVLTLGQEVLHYLRQLQASVQRLGIGLCRPDTAALPLHYLSKLCLQVVEPFVRQILDVIETLVDMRLQDLRDVLGAAAVLCGMTNGGLAGAARAEHFEFVVRLFLVSMHPAVSYRAGEDYGWQLTWPLSVPMYTRPYLGSQSEPALRHREDDELIRIPGHFAWRFVARANQRLVNR